MKKFFSLVALILSIFMIGCGSKNTPSDTVNDYFGVIKAGSNSDFSKTFLSQIIPAQSDALDAETTNAILDILSKLDVTVIDEQITGDTATVNLDIKGVNFNTVLTNFTTNFQTKIKSLGMKTLNLSEDELTSMGRDILIEEIKNAPIENRKCSINLTKNGNDWIINQNDDSFSEAILGMSVTDLQNFTGTDLLK